MEKKTAHDLSAAASAPPSTEIVVPLARQLSRTHFLSLISPQERKI